MVMGCAMLVQFSGLARLARAPSIAAAGFPPRRFFSPWRDCGRRALASVHREVIELLRVEALRELQQLGIDIEQYRTMPL